MSEVNVIGRALDEYQAWTLTTAVYPRELALPYLGLGLGDEAAELLEKALLLEARGNFGVHTGGHAAGVMVLAEAGDVLWYLARLLFERGILMHQVWQPDEALVFDASQLGAVHTIVLACGVVQGKVKKLLRDGADPDLVLIAKSVLILRAIDALARGLGSNLLLVAHSNRSKLEDRKARAVLQGNGDTR